ncbi:MAG: hypothetical protein B9S27_04765 [Opitutia bacterium Tous-C8FEB]|nr:MAG: hypothetical protein B9S27_04765 [Opitutae bacterium Tous-C8FEB]
MNSICSRPSCRQRRTLVSGRTSAANSIRTSRRPSCSGSETSTRETVSAIAACSAATRSAGLTGATDGTVATGGGTGSPRAWRDRERRTASPGDSAVGAPGGVSFCSARAGVAASGPTEKA